MGWFQIYVYLCIKADQTKCMIFNNSNNGFYVLLCISFHLKSLLEKSPTHYGDRVAYLKKKIVQRYDKYINPTRNGNGDVHSRVEFAGVEDVVLVDLEELLEFHVDHQHCYPAGNKLEVITGKRGPSNRSQS